MKIVVPFKSMWIDRDYHTLLHWLHCQDWLVVGRLVSAMPTSNAFYQPSTKQHWVVGLHIKYQSELNQVFNNLAFNIEF